MASETETPRQKLADFWRHVKVRDEWLFDLSAIVVEVNDGKPYCIVPSYSSYLIRAKNSFIKYLARRGDTSGSRAEVFRDVLRRIMGAGLVLSRVKNAALRSAVPDAFWRFNRWITVDSVALKEALKGIETRLTKREIAFSPTRSCIIEPEEPGEPLSCDYEAWIACLACWLVYYMQAPTHEKLFGTDCMVDEENEVGEARNAIYNLSERHDGWRSPTRNAPKEFNCEEAAYILGIPPLAATCLWSMVVIACQGPLIGISQSAREGVIMKYSLGKLLLYSKGTLFHVTREFGKDISRIDFVARNPSSRTSSSRTSSSRIPSPSASSRIPSSSASSIPEPLPSQVSSGDSIQTIRGGLYPN